MAQDARGLFYPIYPDGMMPIEIWTGGRGNKIIGCHTEGGIIGISMAKGQSHGVVSSCTARLAKFIGIELAAASDLTIVGCIVDCDDVTETGVSLDYQLHPDDEFIGTGYVVEGVTVTRPALRGIAAIAPAPTSANEWLGGNINIKATTLFGDAANVKAVEIQNLEGVEIDIFVDGAAATGSQGVVVDSCTGISARARTRRMASQAFQIFRSGTETSDNIHLVHENLDNTGTGVQLLGSSGAFGEHVTLRTLGIGYYGVRNPYLAKVAQADADCLLLEGEIVGSPESVIVAAVGSGVTRTDGGAGTCRYVKETAPTSSTGWVGK